MQQPGLAEAYSFGKLFDRRVVEPVPSDDVERARQDLLALSYPLRVGAFRGHVPMIYPDAGVPGVKTDRLSEFGCLHLTAKRLDRRVPFNRFNPECV